MMPLFPKGKVPGPRPRSNVIALKEAVHDSTMLDDVSCKLYSPEGNIHLVEHPAVKPYLLNRTSAPAIMIAPGGGDIYLAWEKEGTNVAEWLNSLGIHAFVLKYRVPGEYMTGDAMAVQDAQRAMSFVRYNAKRFGVDSNRIGFMGFSYGGIVAAGLISSVVRKYPKVDAADDTDFYPDLAFFIYGGGRYGKPIYKPPPSFSISAKDDPCFVAAESWSYCESIRYAGQECKRILYQNGGHGFGTCNMMYNEWSGKAACNWTDAAADWMVKHRFLSANTTRTPVVIAAPRKDWQQRMDTELQSS